MRQLGYFYFNIIAFSVLILTCLACRLF